MKRLENYGVQKMKKKDHKEINGGGLVGLAISAFFLGRRVEYVKNGGGWFDFYL